MNQEFFTTDIFQHLETLFSFCLDIFPCLLYFFFFLYLILVVDDDRSKLAKSLKTLFMHNIESSLSCFFLLCVCKFGYVYQNNNVVIMQIHELIV